MIALDTLNPPDVVDITFATDNSWRADRAWAASEMNGQKATIAMLDLFNDKVATVDYNRDQGFLTGMGIDTADKTKNGDEASGKYTGGQGGDYEIVCNELTQGAQDGGKTLETRRAGQQEHQPGLQHQRTVWRWWGRGLECRRGESPHRTGRTRWLRSGPGW